MALAAFIATTLLIGVGFVAIGLLVSARQDSSLALAPAKDPWRTALRPKVDEPPVTLMTAMVAEPAVEPPAVADPPPEPVQEPPAFLQVSLDGTPIGDQPVEAVTNEPPPSASRVEPELASEPKRVEEVAAVASSPEPVAPAAEMLTTSALDVVAALPEPAVAPPAANPIVAPPAPNEDPAPVAAALETAADVTASIAPPAMALPAVPEPAAAPAVAPAPLQPAAQPDAQAAVPARTAAKPIATPALKKATQRKAALRAKARARPRATTPSTAVPAQSRGSLDGLFGPAATR
jgi:hypothetical protein